MGSKQAIPVALFAGGLPYVGAGAGNVGPLDGGDYVHVVVPDGAGGFNSRVTTLADLIAQVPASGISQAFADGRYLRRDQELADLLDFVAARNDLNVYSKAEVNSAIAAAIAASTPAPSSLYELTPTVPVIGNYTAINMSGGTQTSGNAATLTTATKGLVLKQAAAPGGVAGQIRFAKYNGYAGANAAFDIKMRSRALGPQIAGSSGPNDAIVVRNTTSGRLTLWGDIGTVWGMYIFGGLDQNAAGSNTWGHQESGDVFPWKRLTSDGTTMIFYQSPDGENWSDGTSYALSAYMGTIDQIGFGMKVGWTNTNGMIVHSWSA